MASRVAMDTTPQDTHQSHDFLTLVRQNENFKKLPVTILSGFLGAGKTSLLTHILTNKKGLKCAVIVNDMAELNIDSQLLKNKNVIQTEEKLIEFQNGCICCTLREDLLLEVSRLAKEGEFDYLVIESTGISEPMQVAETFTFDVNDQLNGGLPTPPALPLAPGDTPKLSTTQQGAAQHQPMENPPQLPINQSLSEVSRLDTCVTVVDASTFLTHFKSEELVADVLPDIEVDDSRSIIHLLTEQIEFANVILLNKIDLVSDEERRDVKHAIRQLNKNAEIIETKKSAVDLGKVINTGKFNFTEAEQHARWLTEGRYDVLNNPESEEYGVSSFVYSADRPFDNVKLHKLLHNNFLSEGEHSEDIEVAQEVAQTKEEYLDWLHKIKDKIKDDRAAKKAHKDSGVFKHLFRSKGFVWLGNRPDIFFEMSQAGLNLEIGIGGVWDAAQPEAIERVTRKQQWQELCKQKLIGDRRQNIIFIGQSMSEYRARITAALNECLVSDEEFDAMFKPSPEEFLVRRVEDDPFGADHIEAIIEAAEGGGGSGPSSDVAAAVAANTPHVRMGSDDDDAEPKLAVQPGATRSDTTRTGSSPSTLRVRSPHQHQHGTERAEKEEHAAAAGKGRGQEEEEGEKDRSIQKFSSVSSSTMSPLADRSTGASLRPYYIRTSSHTHAYQTSRRDTSQPVSVLGTSVVSLHYASPPLMFLAPVLATVTIAVTSLFIRRWGVSDGFRNRKRSRKSKT